MRTQALRGTVELVFSRNQQRKTYCGVPPMLEFFCFSMLLTGGVSHSHGTVGICGYRESVVNHKVLMVYPGSPLEGKIQKGDDVLAIDGDTNNHNTKGEPGSPIRLTIRRDTETFDVTVARIAVQELNNHRLTEHFGMKD